MSIGTEFYFGYRLVETNAITKQIPRRTHRKQRINKKWLKRYGHKTVPDDEKIIISGDNIFATPKTIQKRIAQLKGGEG